MQSSSLSIHIFSPSPILYRVGLKKKKKKKLIHASALSAVANLANTRHISVHQALLRMDSVKVRKHILTLNGLHKIFFFKVIFTFSFSGFKLFVDFLKNSDKASIRQHSSLCLANMSTCPSTHSSLLSYSVLELLVQVCGMHPHVSACLLSCFYFSFPSFCSTVFVAL